MLEWPTDAEASIAPGGIWKTKASGAVLNPKLVVIRREDSEAIWEVFPISFQHQYAGPSDLVIERECSPLGVGFMVEAHLPIFVPRSSLAGRVASLSPEDLEASEILCRTAFGLLSGKKTRDYIRSLPQGIPFTRRDDLRLQFRAVERKNLLYLMENLRNG